MRRYAPAMLLLALLSSPAHASGYYFADSGARAIARGGAFVAGADDLTAQYYNPAALTRVEHSMLSVNGWLVQQYVRFDRADETGTCGAPDPGDGSDPCAFGAVENEAPPMKEPSFGYATRLGGLHPKLDNTVLAVGLYPPTGPSMTYPEDGAQRYTLTDALVLQAWAGPSLAMQVTPTLSVGAGLQWSFLQIEQGLTASLCFTEAGCAAGSDNPANDIGLQIEASDFNQWSGNVGILYQPTPFLDIGASWQPGSTYEAKGSLGASFSEDFALASQLDGLAFADEDIRLAVTLPQTARLGVQVRPVPTVRVEAAGTWTQWSALDALVITDLDLLVKGNPEGLVPEGFLIENDVVLPTGYADSWSARLGGDWQVAPWARVALGGHYETSAVPPATQGVNIVDGDKWGMGGGATFQVGKHLALDVSAARTMFPDRDVTDSELRQLSLYANIADPDAAGVVNGKVVGNGAFASHLSFLALGATWTFGEAPSAAPTATP